MKVNGKKSPSFAVCIALIFAISASVFADSTYIVKKGDTLYSISRRYELTVAELRTANNLSENDVLQAGQKLTIPSADITNAAALSAVPEKKGNVPVSEIAKNTETYTVQKGDTLYSIARRYDIKLYDLLSINNMANDAVIKVGQHIKVPAKSAAVAKNIPNNPSSGKLPSSSQSPARTGDSSLLWPVKHPSVIYTKGKVSGVELSAEKDEPVKSIRAGTVMYTGMYRGYGNIVFVESKTGLIYAYSWLGSVHVKKGDYVVCGDTVGTAGKNAAGSPSLTFMVFQNGMPIDPAKAPRG